MRSQNIDQGWQFQYGIVSGFPDPSGQENIRKVNLPHDYMIESDVTQTAPAGNASGLLHGRCRFPTPNTSTFLRSGRMKKFLSVLTES